MSGFWDKLSAHRYPVAILLACAALAVRLVLDPWLESQLPFTTFFVAIAFSVWIGGYRAGCLTAIVGALLFFTFFDYERLTFGISAMSGASVLLVYGLLCFLVISVAELLRRQSMFRRHTGEKLIASHWRQEIAVNAAGLGVLEWNIREDTSVWENDRMYEIFGHTRRDGTVNRRQFFRNYLHADDVDIMEQALHEAIQDQGKFQAACRIYRKSDGKLRWIEFIGKLNFDASGEPVKLVGVIRDITPRKLMENEIQNTRNRLQVVLDNVPAYIYQVDMQGRYVIVNRAYAELVRGDTHVLPGQPLSRSFPEPVAQEFLANNQQVLDTLSTLTFEETAEVDGIVRTYSSIKTPVIEDGEVVGVLGISTDITDRARMEQALRDSDQRKSEFLAILGHELRNPLAPLSTGLAILEHSSGSPEMIDGVRTMMRRQVAHVVRLVDDLLDLSRISRGKIALKRSRIDLSLVVEAAVEQVKPFITSRPHELTVEKPNAPVIVDGDFDRLTQVIVNLLTNAATYMDPGGSICLALTQENGKGIIRVQDTGFGIPQERLSSIFEMFTQVPEHRSRTGGRGLGVGLALSNQLISMHDGAISVSSRGPGQGSLFTVTLPLCERAPDAPPAVREERRAPPSRIIVVDDNLDAAQSLADLLRLHGHTVATAHEGQEALAAAATFAPDIMLLDIGMPGMDGYELARELRKLPAGAALKLFALTGWGQEEDRNRALEAGFDEHLTKPVDIGRLLSLISAHSRPES